MTPAAFLLKRLEDRRLNNLRTALVHPDEDVRRDAKARAGAYAIAADDVKMIFEITENFS